LPSKDRHQDRKPPRKQRKQKAKGEAQKSKLLGQLWETLREVHPILVVHPCAAIGILNLDFALST
jgi:hypothetical protein